MQFKPVEVGLWTLWENSQRKVILEIDKAVGYFYLWSLDVGMISHLWYFNQPFNDERGFAPVMPSEFINLENYFLPGSSKEVSVTKKNSLYFFDLYCGNTRVGVLNEERVGFSSFVNKSSDLAIPLASFEN